MSNPYEIRLELLKEARDHLMTQWHRQMDWESNNAQADHPAEPIPVPTAEDILRLAGQFKAFVDGP